MKAQTQATIPELKRRFELSPDRPHPGIFVSDFFVLRSLERPGSQIQRHVQLRRGLNILWADPNPEGKVTTKRRSKVAGHTAGKSTFCRLIRYALGDVNFGSDTQERQIINKFTNGWVVLRVEVEGALWIIGRAFFDHAKCFAIPDGDIEAFLANETVPMSGYAEFAASLDRHFVKPLLRDRFPGNKGQIQWRYLLPWFTRDQEARLLSLVTWRGPVGKNQALNTDTDERHFLMRLILDLLPKSEAEQFEAHEVLSDYKRDLDKSLPLAKARTEQAFAQLSEWIDVQAKGLEDPLYFDAIKTENESRQRAIGELRKSIPTTTDLEAKRQIWTEAKSKASDAAGEYNAAKRRPLELEKQIRNCDARLIEQNAAINDLKRLPPATACGIPIESACEKGKQEHAKRPDNPALEIILRTLSESKAQLQCELAAALEEVKVCRMASEAAQEIERAAQHDYLSTNTKRTELLERYLEENAEQKARDRLLESTRQVLKTKLREEDALKQTVKDIRKATSDEAEARRVKTPELGHFSALYEKILRYMLGGEEGEATERIYGAVQHDGRKLDVTAEGRNDLESGAITAAKLISFDLAAMAWGMEGKGHHPRFVIHDSPREADMAEDIYAGLFEAAFALEQAAGENPSFQYIVTTTAKPPEHFNTAPWRLDPVLNALVAEQRILKLDL